MKTRKFINITVLSVLALVVLSLSSCLKDPRFIDFSTSPPLIEFPAAAANANKTQAVSPSVAAGKYTLTVAVNLASPSLLGSDVTVTVAVDNTVLTAAGTSTAATSLVTPTSTSAAIPTYFPLPPADYTVSNLKPVIVAGQRLAYFTVSIDPALMGTTVKNYALRFVIKDGGGQQISSYNAITYLVQAKP